MESQLKSRSRGVVTLLLAGCLLSPFGSSRAQNSGPERDRWQHPNEVMDALGVKAGSMVADVGCGKGYFAINLAQRAGPTGKVYAEDLQQDVLDDVRQEAAKLGLKQVETVLGSSADPHLPLGALDVVLSVNSYHEWVEYDAMLDHIFAALKPRGLFGLIDGDAKPGRNRETYHQDHVMPKSMELDDITHHGFHLVREEPGFTRTNDDKKFFFLIFSR